MSSTPMRSVIRVLADSPLVEKIALDHENNNVKIYYKSNDKNADSIRDVVEIINFYFKKMYDADNALTLVEKASLPKRRNYYINAYTTPKFELFRIDIQDAYISESSYYEPSGEIAAIELTCLGYARDFIFGELRKKESARRGVVEFNYANLQEQERRARYLGELKQLPSGMAKLLDVSLVRLPPETTAEAIDATIDHFDRLIADTCVSLHFDDNLPLIEAALGSRAARVFVTIDFQNLADEAVLEDLSDLILGCKNGDNTFVIQYNIDNDSQKMIGKRGNVLRYAGRQVVRRA